VTGVVAPTDRGSGEPGDAWLVLFRGSNGGKGFDRDGKRSSPMRRDPMMPVAAQGCERTANHCKSFTRIRRQFATIWK